MTHAKIVELLQQDNTSARLGDVNMYADSFVQWQEASENIRKNGSICAHPRTGAPMTNPYLSIQTAALKNLRRFPRLKTDRLWEPDQIEPEEK